MKVLKVLLLVLTLGLGKELTETKLPIATLIKGGPQTINSILAGNSATLAVVGDYEYFLQCNKYKLLFKKVKKEQEVKRNYLKPLLSSENPIKTC